MNGELRRLDTWLLYAVLGLMGLGVVMVYSASSVNAAARLGDPDFFLKRQGAFAVLGLGAIWVGYVVRPELWRKLALPLLGGACALLVLVQVPGIGRSGGGAQRWINLGPLALQPSEFCKFAILVFLAYSLEKKADHIRTFRIGVVPHAGVPAAMCVLLMAQPDFGTSVVIMGMAAVLMMMGGVRLRYLLAAGAVALPTAALLIMGSAYRRNRVLAFLDPFGRRKDVGYQVAESLISFGSGGLTGTGLGAGKQKLFFLPAAHTDFIFAIIGEELGLLGVTCVVGAFAVVAWRGLEAARRLGPGFLGFLCGGLTCLIVLQACINMAVVMGMVPTKGLTLPFVSYGGSSLLAFCFMAGVLLRLSSMEPDEEPVPARQNRTAWRLAGVRP